MSPMFLNHQNTFLGLWIYLGCYIGSNIFQPASCTDVACHSDAYVSLESTCQSYKKSKLKERERERGENDVFKFWKIKIKKREGRKKIFSKASPYHATSSCGAAWSRLDLYDTHDNFVDPKIYFENQQFIWHTRDYHYTLLQN